MNKWVGSREDFLRELESLYFHLETILIYSSSSSIYFVYLNEQISSSSHFFNSFEWRFQSCHLRLKSRRFGLRKRLVTKRYDNNDSFADTEQPKPMIKFQLKKHLIKYA